jgi:hypothetical protein
MVTVVGKAKGASHCPEASPLVCILGVKLLLTMARSQGQVKRGVVLPSLTAALSARQG